MSTLKLQSNPFLVHGRSHSDNHYLSRNMNNTIDHLNMPRTYSPPIVSTPYTDRKRKFDEDLLVTPEHLTNNDALITPPRSHKRPKTVPSSPINSQDIYETPKTPSFKQDFTITLGSSRNLFSPPSPSYHSSPSTFQHLSDNVTPPQSSKGSPRQVAATLASPTVIPSRQSQGEYGYMYADTCYPFNIGGSAVGRSEGNLRLKTWREACNEKVRHEYNKALKDYNAYSTRLEGEAVHTMNQAPVNAPTLFDERIFPSAAKMSKIAFGNLKYPFASKIDNSDSKIEDEVNLLLNFKNQNVKKTATYPLKHSNHVKLPPISDILKFTPFDKSTIHPSGLSTLEINQYQDSKLPGFTFERSSKLFYNGREIKKNAVPIVEETIQEFQYNYEPTFNKTSLSQYSINNYQQPQPQMEQPLYTPPPITTTLAPITQPQLQSPIKLKPIRTKGGANAYDDLSSQIKDLSDDETLKKNSMKQFQSQFRTHTLKVNKTRKDSVSKVTKHSRTSSAASTSTVSSRRSSRSSSRKSSDSSSSINKNKSSVSNVTAGYRGRTRSSSRSRSSSTNSIRTAEAPASVETTPKTSPNVQKQQSYTAKTNSLLFPTYENNTTPSHSHNHHHNKILDFSKSTILSVEPMKAKIPIGKLSSMSTQQVSPVHAHAHAHPHSPTHQHTIRTKKCMSCFSSSSPCWRPSWSPEEGQLCNSCGLRYRKTKARCYNPSCLKIPSKSEWALMVKRGEVLLDIYDSKGNVTGKKMSYRCLDCDSAMEVLH